MKVKPIIVIIATLVIGFVLGMLTSAQLRLHKLKPVRMYYSEERFREGFYNVIQPTDEQKAKFEVILDKYAIINGDLQNQFRKDMDETMKEFRREIDSNLSKEQLTRLREMDERRQQMIRNNWNQRDSAGSRRIDRGPGHEGSGRPPQHRYPRRDTLEVLPESK